jgi:hypothetical protein
MTSAIVFMMLFAIFVFNKIADHFLTIPKEHVKVMKQFAVKVLLYLYACIVCVRNSIYSQPLF